MTVPVGASGCLIADQSADHCSLTGVPDLCLGVFHGGDYVLERGAVAVGRDSAGPVIAVCDIECSGYPEILDCSVAFDGLEYAGVTGIGFNLVGDRVIGTVEHSGESSVDIERLRCTRKVNVRVDYDLASVLPKRAVPTFHVSFGKSEEVIGIIDSEHGHRQLQLTGLPGVRSQVEAHSPGSGEALSCGGRSGHRQRGFAAVLLQIEIPSGRDIGDRHFVYVGIFNGLHRACGAVGDSFQSVRLEFEDGSRRQNLYIE